MPRLEPQSHPRFQTSSSFILSIKRFDRRHGERVTLIDVRTGERFTFDSLEAAWFFLGEQKPHPGLK